MQSVLEVLKKCEDFFAKKGVPNPKLDAQLLLAGALGCKRLDLFLRFEDPIPEKELSDFREYARRRAKREPLQHILGSVEFFSLKLKCDARALVPRHETERLCEIITEALADKKNEPIKILDLGTGSGAIILALKSFFLNSKCAASDTSENALSLAKENAEACGLDAEFVKSDWFKNIEGKYDIIVSNPPYLTSEEVENAQEEVRLYDPPEALSSPDEGLKDLREIIKDAPKFLEHGGILALECGLEQPKILAAENAANADFSKAEILPDLSGRDRFLMFARA